MSDETRAIRLRRLGMRSVRRGTREMDIVLSRFARARLALLDPGMLDLYEAFLEENDQNLYQWISGQVAPPPRFQALTDEIIRYGATLK